MEEYMINISQIDIGKDRRKQQNDICSKQEQNSCLELTGSLDFLGHGVLPQAGFIESHLH